MKRQEKLLAIAMMKELAMADGKIDQAEQRYLAQAAQHLHLDIDALEELQEDHCQSGQLPQSEHHRMVILYYLLFLASANQKIVPMEENYLISAAIDLGFRETQIKKMLDIVKSNQNGLLNPEALLGVIRSVLN